MKTTGMPINRVDGPAKVRGEAKYAAEFTAQDLAYGVVVSSTIAKGRITAIHTDEAHSVPGVITVLTHENRPNTAWFNYKHKDEDAPKGDHFRPLYDDEVQYSGQPIALVVAQSFEAARYAASLVRADYESQPPETNLSIQRSKAYTPKRPKTGYEPPPSPRGNEEKAFAAAPFKITAEYICPVEHHNPMEMHAATVVWEGDGQLTLHDKTQGPQNSQKYICNAFGLKSDKVRVVSPFVGGAFGSGLRPQYQLFLATMAATELKRSVRVVLTRQQMFTFGHRPNTIHNIAMSSNEAGELQSIKHEAVAETSQFEDYAEVVVNWSGMGYKCDNVTLDHKLARLDTFTPLDMRAPGAAWGVYALESAIDEMAVEAGVDPLEFRIKNYTEKDQNHKRPFSSRELMACYTQGAEQFGWSRRKPKARSMRDGHKLVGWGMASGFWDAMQMKASAAAKLTADGKLEVSSATADIGTGTYTIMTQLAAEAIGLPIEDVSFKLGDSSLPMAPLEGGSWTAASVGTAVDAVCTEIREKVFKLAQKIDGSPLAKVKLKEVEFVDGRIRVIDAPENSISIVDVMKKSEADVIEETITTTPSYLKQFPYSRTTNSAVFVEVKVDEDLGVVEVTRVVSAVAAGRILNTKTARSQILGGVVWGISMALHEESLLDHNLGRFMNHNYAEYHVPVMKDMPEIDVIFVDEKDDIVNPIGVKGLGEIGIVGVAGAVANAIYHATGKRVRDLPITLDKLI